jgi:signal peptidase I
MRSQSGFIEVIVIGGTVILAAIATFAYLFLFQPFRMSGSSMMPYLVNSEYFMAQKIDRNYHNGDIVVFINPRDNRQMLVKRIIAVPGDKIKLAGSEVYLNGQKLNESYLKEPLKTYPGKAIQEGQEFDVPADSFFMMGDNREYSADSREYGFINKANIIGKYWFSYYK